MSDAELLLEINAGVAYLTLNRPEKRNALSCRLLEELDEAQARLVDEHRAQVVVLAARGAAFCSGHDLTEMAGQSEGAYRDLFALCSRVMLGFRRLPQPVIARVQGLATAAGCQLVASCDLVVAAHTAAFATPGVKIGLFCTTPMVPLVRAIPPRNALEMLLTGKPVSAQRAFELGLVNKVVAADQLDATIGEYVEALLAASPAVLRLGKSAFYDQLSLNEDDAYQRASEIMTANALQSDAQEGITAFLQKRRPIWQME
jgi:enoyl-CoA hydratase/carnithine racemase